MQTRNSLDFKKDALTNTVPCRWCGNEALYIDKYLCPFEKEKKFFSKDMKIYFCDNERLGFAYPIPDDKELIEYYRKVYRDRNKFWQEDPGKNYTGSKTTPLSNSQFMYIAEFLDFSSIKTVIDMGCGHGAFLKEVELHNPNARLIGIDLDPSVQEPLKDVDALIKIASTKESVDFICENVVSNSLLVSSQTLHYEGDYDYLKKIIRRVKSEGKINVYLFIEVPNNVFDNLLYLKSRLYDVPQIVFFTKDAFFKIFDIDVMNVATNGWSIEKEHDLRKSALDRYNELKRKNINPNGVFHYKTLVPKKIRRAVKAFIETNEDKEHLLSYYSYGGNRRSIRFIGRIS